MTRVHHWSKLEVTGKTQMLLRCHLGGRCRGTWISSSISSFFSVSCLRVTWSPSNAVDGLGIRSVNQQSSQVDCPVCCPIRNGLLGVHFTCRRGPRRQGVAEESHVGSLNPILPLHECFEVSNIMLFE